MRTERDEPPEAGRSDPVPSVGRRTVLASGAAVGTGAVAGCLSGGIEALVDETFRSEADASVAIVSSPDGFDAGGVDGDALSGIRAAASRYDVDVDVVEEPDPTRYEGVQASLAGDGYDLIVCVGASHREGLEANAAAFPDQRWTLVGEPFGGAESVSAWIGMRTEMAFLAGVAAGTLTREEIDLDGRTTDPSRAAVGFVGYDPDEELEAIERSYVEGVRWVDEDVIVLVNYVAGRYDPQRMWIRADAQYRAGVDIVYQAYSGQTDAVFVAARENDRFALGADVDQSALDEASADALLGSADTAYDVATFRVVQAIVEDDWGRVRGNRCLGVETGGVGFVVGRAFQGVGGAHDPLGIADGFPFGGADAPALPDSLYDALERASEALVDGTVELACGPRRC